MSLEKRPGRPLSKTKRELSRSLGSPKIRRRRALFSAEGAKSVSDLLSAFGLEALIAERSFIERGALPEELRRVAGDKFRSASPAEMRELSNLTTPPEVIGIFHLPEENNDTVPHLGPGRLYLLLDGVRDPGNFGTILRSADWFGIHEVFASHDSADLFNPKVIQATMGSLAHVRVRYTDLPSLVRANPELPLVGTLLEGEDIYRAELPAGGLIAMGNEGKGLSEEMRSLVSFPLTIPPAGEIHGESLNVGAATAVVLSQFQMRKRGV